MHLDNIPEKSTIFHDSIHRPLSLNINLFLTLGCHNVLIQILELSTSIMQCPKYPLTIKTPPFTHHAHQHMAPSTDPKTVVVGSPYLELPDLANKSTGYPVKLEFQTKKSYFSLCPI